MQKSSKHEARQSEGKSTGHTSIHKMPTRNISPCFPGAWSQGAGRLGASRHLQRLSCWRSSKCCPWQVLRKDHLDIVSKRASMTIAFPQLWTLSKPRSALGTRTAYSTCSIGASSLPATLRCVNTSFMARWLLWIFRRLLQAKPTTRAIERYIAIKLYHQHESLQNLRIGHKLGAGSNLVQNVYGQYASLSHSISLALGLTYVFSCLLHPCLELHRPCCKVHEAPRLNFKPDVFLAASTKQCLLIKEPGNQCGKGYLQHQLDCSRRFLSGKARIYLHNANWQSYPFGQAAVVTRSASMPPDWAKQRNFYSPPPHRHPAMWQSNCEANQNHQSTEKLGGVLCGNPQVSSRPCPQRHGLRYEESWFHLGKTALVILELLE